MSLVFYVLNVRHGLSVVVEFQNEDEKVFGVIDSNTVPGQPVRALETLRQLGAEKLSFVCLTHPHADHYSGLSEILRVYDGNIEHFFAFSLNRILFNRPWLKKLAAILDAQRRRGDDPMIISRTNEFMRIIKWADDHKELWTECDGDEARIAPSGFHEVDIHTIVPAAKGIYLNVIDKQDPMAFGYSS